MYHNTYALGDHLVTQRNGYEHHGIYAGSGRVIHYLLEGVSFASLATFTTGRKVWVEQHSFVKYSPAEAVARAQGRMGEDDYNLIFSNCEHFVNWCINGVSESSQVRTATSIAGGLIAAGLAAYAVTQWWQGESVDLDMGMPEGIAYL